MNVADMNSKQDAAHRSAGWIRLTLLTALCGSHAAIATNAQSTAIQDAAQPSATLHFTNAEAPAQVQPFPGDLPRNATDLAFKPGAIINTAGVQLVDRPNPLAIASDLILLRLDAMEEQQDRDEQADTQAAGAKGDPFFAPEGFSLRFEHNARADALWSRNANAPGGTLNRLEVLPALYLRSGRVHDTGFESLDYADMYAELGVDLTTNTGLSLRYERLRQALGQQREGEQVDADALFLQFELRF